VPALFIDIPPFSSFGVGGRRLQPGVLPLSPVESSNRTLMLSVMAAFRDGNLDPLFDILDEDVIWTSTAPPEFFRFGGTRRGRAGVKEYTALLFVGYHYTRFVPHNVIARGDQVWGVFEVEALHRATGRYVRTDASIAWTLRGGKLIAHQGFFDTAGILMQQGVLSAA
jgi:ketosteroid isomerase-like protein